MQFKLIHPFNVWRTNIVLRRFINTTKNEKKIAETIVIPKAIPRSPTDILKVLSSIVERDSTGPHYQYIDDPYLTPINNVDKRTFALSKEAGRKTARYFFDKYPELFFRDMSEPKIEAFVYKEIFDESMQFDELNLKRSIIKCEVTNAIVCYEKLVKDDIPIEKNTLYDLLDLVCFYNCEDEPERFISEEFFQKSFKKPIIVNKWKDNGFAEKLFEAIEPKNDRVYSSIIMGMAKHGQSERAFSFYRQAIDSGMKLNVWTYNSLISASYEMHSSNDERWKTITELLKTMNSNQIAPNIGTLNSILKQLAKYKFWDKNPEMVKRVFNEFAFRFNIRPSLATYYHVINNVYRSKNSKNSLIYEIMDKIAGEKFQIQDADDVYFFPSAMEIAFNLNDVKLAKRINTLFENNPISCANFLQNAYYHKFLKLLCLFEPIESFMTIYRKYVPHVYTSNIDLMEHILKTIKLYKAFNYIPEIYDDIRLFYYTYHIEVVCDLLLAMDEIEKEDPLLSKFNEIVWDVFHKVNLKIAKNEEMGYEKNLQWTAKTLALCLSIFNKSNDIEKGLAILEKMNSSRNDLFDDPDSKCLVDFCKMALAEKKYNHLIYCLKFCKEIGKQDVLDVIKEEMKNISIKDEGVKQKIERYF